MAVFTWVPSKSYTKKSKPRVKEISFGDGYSQRVPEDINILAAEWNLTFSNRPIAEANALTLFLEDKKGASAFSWTPQGQAQVSVICTEWDEKYTSHISRTITAKFKLVYEVVL